MILCDSDVLIAHFRGKSETTSLLKRLSAEGLAVSEEISNLATELIINYSKSHALSVPDALIGATAIVNAIPLLTYNQKHFAHISKLSLQAY